MELHQLVYVVAVARHLNFTRAAAELHVAQPSVSQQIRKLEEELGAPLFHRIKRRVTLTEAGEVFLPRARGVLRLLEEARAEVQELSELRRGTLAVGAPPSLGTRVFPETLAAFGQRYPGIALVFRESGSRTLAQQLAEGELDLAVVIEPVRHPALETVPLLEEELVLAVPAGHRLAGRRQARLDELRDERFVLLREGVYELRDQTVAICEAAGFAPRVALDGAEMDNVLRFVGAGLGVAILPESVARGAGVEPALAGSPEAEPAGAPAGAPAASAGANDAGPGGWRGTAVLRIAGAGLRRTLVVARRRDRARSAASQAFEALLRERLAGAPAAAGASAL